MSFCEYGQACTCWFDRCCKWDWSWCCTFHDRRYENTRLNRSQADELLRRCVKRKTSSSVFAFIMWLGVRLFGWTRYNSKVKSVQFLKTKEGKD